MLFTYILLFNKTSQKPSGLKQKDFLFFALLWTCWGVVLLVSPGLMQAKGVT